VGENYNESIQDDKESNDNGDSSSEASDEPDEDSSNSDDDSDEEDADDADLEDYDDFEVVDRNSIEDVLAEPRIPLGVPAHTDEDGDEIPALVPRVPRSTRERRQPERLCTTAIKLKKEAKKTFKKKNKRKVHIESYTNAIAGRIARGKTLFEHDDEYEMEKLHNLHATTTKDNTLVYEGEEAYVIARMIT